MGRRGKQPRTTRAPSSRSLGSLSAAPDRVPAGDSAFGTLPLERAKEKEKFAGHRPGSPHAGQREALPRR